MNRLKQLGITDPSAALPGIRRGIVYSIHEGEAGVVDPYHTALHALNPVATRILVRVAAHDSLSEIVETLVRDFEVDRQTAVRDTVEFLATLQENELLSESTKLGSDEEPGPPPPFRVSREQLEQMFRELEDAGKKMRAERNAGQKAGRS